MRFTYYGHFERISDCEGWIATTLERAGHYCLRIQRNRDVFDPLTLIQAIQQSEADFLLLSKTPEITKEQLLAVKAATGVKVVFWTFDWMRDPANWRWYEPLAKLADVCFQTDGWGGDGYEGINRVELHQGAFPDLHHPVVPTAAEREKYTADVAFCGSIYTARRAALVRELRRYPGFRLWGPATEELWGRPFAAMVACTKIIVCDNYVNDVPGYWSDRIYLTMACGGFVAAADVPGIDRVFGPRKEIQVWENWEQLHAIIEDFTRSEESRKFIATAGSHIVRAHHSYNRRIDKMVRVLEGLK